MKYSRARKANLPRAALSTAHAGVTLLFFSAVCCLAACSHPQAAAQSAPPPPFQFLGGWGTPGAAPGQLEAPRTLTVDFAGNVFVADAQAQTQIEKFSSLGQPRLAFAADSSNNPWDIAIDPGNAIFLVDPRRAQVQIFSPEGEHFRTLSFRYRRLFKTPSSIAFDESGNFFLADFLAGRISKLSPRGHLYQSWPKPDGLPVRRWSPCLLRLGPEGNLYVADAPNQRIEKLAPDGRYMTSWDFPFSDVSLKSTSPKELGLAVSQNYVAASDETTRHLEIWTLDGQSKIIVDFSHHPDWGAAAAPSALAFAPNGDLFVLDGAESRVLHFRLNIPPAAAAPAAPGR